jgi:hypothetical protein
MNNECGIFELPYVRQGQDCTNSWQYTETPLSHGLDHRIYRFVIWLTCSKTSRPSIRSRVVFPVHRAIFLSSLCGVLLPTTVQPPGCHSLAMAAAAGVPLYLSSSFLRTVTLVYSLHRVFVLG